MARLRSARLLAFIGTAVSAYLVGDELRDSAGRLLFTLLMALLAGQPVHHRSQGLRRAHAPLSRLPRR